jgi:hypothetical protein
VVRQAVRQAHGPERSRRGIQLRSNIIIFFLDPGSRPPSADLAGITNLRHSPLREKGTCGYRAELITYAHFGVRITD